MTHALDLPTIEPEAELSDRVAALLRALGIEQIDFSLDGSGDSGDTTLDAIRYQDGRDDTALPDIAIGFLPDGRPRLLADYLDGIASDLPEGDWVNNEGGYGTVTIRPFESDPFERFTCDMTYRDEYEDEEPDDEIEEETSFESIELAAANVAVQS